MVVTHDGGRLFAYAASRQAIEEARAKLEAALAADGMQTTPRSHHLVGRARRVGRPRRRRRRPKPASAQAVGTRTYVVTLGRWVREEFEQSVGAWATQLGVRYEIVEHPHLLNSQVAVHGHRARREARRVRRGDERRGAGDDPHRDRRDGEPALESPRPGAGARSRAQARARDAGRGDGRHRERGPLCTGAAHVATGRPSTRIRPSSR